MLRRRHRTILCHSFLSSANFVPNGFTTYKIAPRFIEKDLKQNNHRFFSQLFPVQTAVALCSLFTISIQGWRQKPAENSSFF